MKVAEESGWIDLNGDFRKDRQYDHSGKEIPINRYVPLDIAETLERELAEAKAESQWQPIATAPKDGTRILLCYSCDSRRKPSSYGIGFWFQYADDEWEQWWELDEKNSPQIYPSHWMLLPQPPNEQP